VPREKKAIRGPDVEYPLAAQIVRKRYRIEQELRIVGARRDDAGMDFEAMVPVWHRCNQSFCF